MWCYGTQWAIFPWPPANKSFSCFSGVLPHPNRFPSLLIWKHVLLYIFYACFSWKNSVYASKRRIPSLFCRTSHFFYIFCGHFFCLLLSVLMMFGMNIHVFSAKASTEKVQWYLLSYEEAWKPVWMPQYTWTTEKTWKILICRGSRKNGPLWGGGAPPKISGQNTIFGVFTFSIFSFQKTRRCFRCFQVH